MKVIRYAVKMRSGSFMKIEDEERSNTIRIREVDLPIDATLLRNRKDTERDIKRILNEDIFLAVRRGSGVSITDVEHFVLDIQYDKNNPPEKVVEVEIDYSIKEMD